MQKFDSKTDATVHLTHCLREQARDLKRKQWIIHTHSILPSQV